MAREHGGEYLCVDGHVAVDQSPYIKAIVNGSKQVSRDPLEGAESVLDPDGDMAYRIEIARRGYSQTKMCSNPSHLGERWLPVGEFSTDSDTGDKRDCWCHKCRKEAAFRRRVREAEQEGRKLRGHAGRPRK